MKNSYFRLPTYVTDDNYEVKDIIATHKNRKLSDTFIKDNSNYWYYSNIQDNSRLELIAYTEYQDSSLWDVLFMINQMDNVWDLPKGSDYIDAEVQGDLKKFIDLFGSNKLQETLVLRTNELYEYHNTLNDKHRKFRFVYPQFIPNLMKKLITYNL